MREAEPPIVAETVVVALSASDRPSLEQAAGVLKTSPRTLQRRLNQAGVSFSEILERSAAAQACRLLAESREEIRSISRKLGYRDPSSFIRAFRRWTGTSPRQYRERPAPIRH